MKLVAMTTETQISPNWWRIESPLKKLSSEDFDVTIQRSFDTEDVPDGSIVFMLRPAARSTEVIDIFVKKLRAKGCILVLDLDDAIFEESFIMHLDQMYETFDAESKDIMKLEQKCTIHLMRLVDAVTVTTPFLKIVVQRFCKTPTYVLPNLIDVEWFDSCKEGILRFDDDILVGWAGSGRPQFDLMHMAAAWTRIADKHKNVNFVLGGWRPEVLIDAVPEDRLIYRKWTDLGAYPQVMKVDIGCTPLRDTTFNWCKSPIKVMEYTLGEAAVVGSPVVYGSIIRHGEDGFLAYSTEEWFYYIDYLIVNPEVRMVMQQTMAAKILSHHSLDSNWLQWPIALHHIKEMAKK